MEIIFIIKFKWTRIIELENTIFCLYKYKDSQKRLYDQV